MAKITVVSSSSSANSASNAAATLIEASGLLTDRVESASLWVISVRDLIIKAKQKGQGNSLIGNGGYITVLQKNNEVLSMPFLQTLNARAFQLNVAGDDVTAKQAALSYNHDGTALPYNVKLQLDARLCRSLIIAACGGDRLNQLFANEIADHNAVNPTLPTDAIGLLSTLTRPASWWNKLQQVLTLADLQVQLLVMANAATVQNSGVKKIHNTDNLAFEYDVTPSIVGVQVVSRTSPLFIQGVDLPLEVVKLTVPCGDVVVYDSIDAVPLNAKNAQAQLKKLLRSFLAENPTLVDSVSLTDEFLAKGVTSAKLQQWLSVGNNGEVARHWISKKGFVPVLAATTVESQEFTATEPSNVKVFTPSASAVSPVTTKAVVGLPGFSAEVVEDDDDDFSIVG